MIFSVDFEKVKVQRTRRSGDGPQSSASSVSNGGRLHSADNVSATGGSNPSASSGGRLRSLNTELVFNDVRVNEDHNVALGEAPVSTEWVGNDVDRHITDTSAEEETHDDSCDGTWGAWSNKMDGGNVAPQTLPLSQTSPSATKLAFAKFTDHTHSTTAEVL
eukprot:Lankesteria_metandrocarpae@DN7248_c0_g1_i1.p1